MTFPPERPRSPKEGLQPRDQEGLPRSSRPSAGGSAQRTGHAGCALGALSGWGSSGLSPLAEKESWA